MTKLDVGGIILRGAHAKFFGRDTLDDNPYPDAPGYYTMYRAWRYGFLNWEQVLDEHDASPVNTARRMVAHGRL